MEKFLSIPIYFVKDLLERFYKFDSHFIEKRVKCLK